MASSGDPAYGIDVLIDIPKSPGASSRHFRQKLLTAGISAHVVYSYLP